MLCELCKKKDATTFVQVKNENKFLEVYLCEECAKEKHSKPQSNFFKDDNNQKLCSCNTRWQEIIESGFVGCAKCYETFYEELMPIISSLHGHLEHKGKKAFSKVEILKNQIQQAEKHNFFSLSKKLKEELEKIGGVENE